MRDVISQTARRIIAGTVLERRLRNLSYALWLNSPEGPRPTPDLRSLAPGLGARLLLWVEDVRHGRVGRVAKAGRLYLPSRGRTKVRAIRWHARRYGPRVFVETGTGFGDTTAAVADLFAQCFTIELSAALHQHASARLAKIEHVRCLQGDSGRIVSDLLRNQISGPALFWLDAHTSGGNTASAGYDPIFAELDAILSASQPEHVILIDDARGHQVDKIRAMVPRGRSFANKNDIVRITPAG
jgi:hypothetical protein